MGFSWFGLSSFAVCAVAYGAVALVLLLGQPANKRASLLSTAIAGSSAWAVGIVFLMLRSPGISLALWVALDAAHLFLWTVCVLSWLDSNRSRSLWLASLAAGTWAVVAAFPTFAATAFGGSVYSALTVQSLTALLVVEQVYRNAQHEQRASLRLLCGAIGGIAIADLFVYSQAALFESPVSFFWQARGFASALLLPLIVLGVRRQAVWRRELFVSRHVLFYTTSLLGVGAYLLAMGGVGYVIRGIGRQWSVWLELVFFGVAVGVLFYVLFSTTVRARVRAALVKHFYRTKYDYRQEWLRLTQSLGRSGDLHVLAYRGLEALARIVGSNRGDLWLTRGQNHYEWTASFGGGDEPRPSFDANHAMVAFLSTRGWVIDSEEYWNSPDLYDTAFGSPEDNLLPKGAIIVPLDSQGFLQGFVALEKPAIAGRLNFEDHDILKTAGKQVAVVLAQSLALEKLAETRQFEAMNKMSTFLMHDLKNIIAQQQLVVSNAARFRQRPEFFDDAIATVRAGVERMRHVLEQLKANTGAIGAGRADLSKVLMEVRSHCADRMPVPTIVNGDKTLWVRMERTRLVSVLTHLVRNAQEATPSNGEVRLEASIVGNSVICSVADTGCGMDAAFVRDRLFRPFDSTKGAQGMGIGAYQVRDVVRAIGGDVEVSSTPNVGTVFRIRLPLADAPDSVRAAASA